MNSLLRRLLERIVRTGDLTFVDSRGRELRLGDGTGTPLKIAFHDTTVERELLRHPELTLGETYMDGRWSVAEGTLKDVLHCLMVNIRNEPPSRARLWLRWVTRGLAQNNSTSAARRNAKHHYDVGNDIYRLFLDEDWQYSCGYFPEEGMSLDAAQKAKKRHIASKLLLEPGRTVLDIGCGWGGMALYLADYTGAKVTGITLADQQASEARDRAGNRADVQFRVQDYREVRERFDRIVSVGMFEHVGVAYYDAFFQNCHRILKDDGVMLLHSIGRFNEPGATNPFIAKHIFPGGYIPALSEVLPVIERTGLFVTDVEIWRLHYAETLKAWRERFMARRDEVVSIMDERFLRMWEFYLAGSEAAFRSGEMMVFQLQLSRSLDAVPLSRDYMMHAESALASRDTGRPAGPTLVAGQG